MFTVNDTATAVFLCVLTMIGWGSWANTQKLAERRAWPFALFYWDYCIGVALGGVIFAASLGSFGAVGQGAAPNLASAALACDFRAVAAGLLFNLANVLLVAAIDATGLAIAFPLGIGLALIIGTVASYLQTPRGNPQLLALGVACILLAMVLSAFAHSRRPTATEAKRAGIFYAILAGALMGFFYPQLLRAVSPDFNTKPITAGTLTPYAALALFGVGVLVSGVPLTSIFLRGAGGFRSYSRAPLSVHLPGLLGGLIWMAALTLNVVASGRAGPAVSYALGQGATLIAALWGIFVWREFRGARSGTGPLLALMLCGYSLGLLLIGLAAP
jgi:glucose uptake protein